MGYKLSSNCKQIMLLDKRKSNFEIPKKQVKSFITDISCILYLYHWTVSAIQMCLCLQLDLNNKHFASITQVLAYIIRD